MGFFEKIKQGLTRTKENIGHSFAELFAVSLCALFLLRVYRREIAPMLEPK